MNINPGETQVVTGYNYNRGEQACLTVVPGSLSPNCTIVGEDGTVTFSFTVPTDSAPGSYTVTVTGKVSGAQSASYNVTAPPAQVVVKTGGNADGSMMPYGLLMALSMGTAGVWIGTRQYKVGER